MPTDRIEKPQSRRHGPQSRAVARLLLALAIHPAGASAQTVEPGFYVTNGPVHALARLDNTLYLGGEFTRLSPASGGGIPFDATAWQPLAGYPGVIGTVHVAIPDGAGGWFIGGRFSFVGGLPRANLAHILSNLEVASWNPGTDGTVRALAIHGTELYVGGSFSQLGGQPRGNLGAVDIVGGLTTSFDLPPDGEVLALAFSNATTLWVGGSFLNIAAVPRRRLAAIDITSGLKSPVTEPNASVRAIAAGDLAIYIGGDFTSPRKYLAAVDAGGSLLSWDPNAGQPWARSAEVLRVVGNMVYVGGQNDEFPSRRGNVSAFRADNGAIDWRRCANGPVHSLSIAGDALYAGGSFTAYEPNQFFPAGTPRLNFFALTLGGSLLPWTLEPNQPVHAMAGVSAPSPLVYVGGAFTGTGGVARTNLAAIDLTTGVPTAWNPGPPSGAVHALAVHPPSANCVWVGGDFTYFGGIPHDRLVAVTTALGNALDWHPGADGRVSEILIDEAHNAVLIGGMFSLVNGVYRPHLAAVDASTGAVTGWNPGLDEGTVLDLVQDATNVYVAGDFWSIAGTPRSHLAAVDKISGAVTEWDPSADAPVHSIAIQGSTLFAAGEFSAMGGSARQRLAAVDLTSGEATAWDPGSDAIVRRLATGGPAVYASGDFSEVGGTPRDGMAALDLGSGTILTHWAPQLQDVSTPASVDALLRDGSRVYVGGSFLGALGVPRSNLAVLSDAVVGVATSSPSPRLGVWSHPNPVRSHAFIGFRLDHGGAVDIQLFDLQGREVGLPIERHVLGPGFHRLRLDLADLPVGIYAYRVVAGSALGTGRIVVLH